MRRFSLVLLLALAALPAAAQSIATNAHGEIVVAHDGAIELFDANANQRLWRSSGVAHAGAIVVGQTTVAVLDPLANRAGVFDLASGKGNFFDTGETPIAGVIADGNLYLLERDARALERIGRDGSRAVLPLAADPAFLRAARGRLYVYSRVSGTIQEITIEPFAVARTIESAPFASDFEIGGRTAYTVHPRDSTVRMIDIDSGKAVEELKVGAVPVDLAFVGGDTALSAQRLAVADPSSKRVWVVEGHQSVMQAFARGFLRGLIGLGLGGNGGAFSSGVDRVVVRGSAFVAYDSSSGTLFRFSGEKATVLATGIAPSAFAVTPSRIVWWKSGTLVAQKANG